MLNAWEWFRSVLFSLDFFITTVDDLSLIRLDYPKGLREHAVLWMIGIYIELVETEVVSKGKTLQLPSVIGHFKQRKQLAKFQALPDIGFIPQIDTDQMGIG